MNTEKVQDIEKSLYEDAKNIEIDLEFKKKLKNKILLQAKEEKQKCSKSFKYPSYLKVASMLAFLVLVGGGSTAANRYGSELSHNELFGKNEVYEQRLQIASKDEDLLQLENNKSVFEKDKQNNSKKESVENTKIETKTENNSGEVKNEEKTPVTKPETKENVKEILKPAQKKNEEQKPVEPKNEDSIEAPKVDDKLTASKEKVNVISDGMQITEITNLNRLYLGNGKTDKELTKELNIKAIEFLTEFPKEYSDLNIGEIQKEKQDYEVTTVIQPAKIWLYEPSSGKKYLLNKNFEDEALKKGYEEDFQKLFGENSNYKFVNAFASKDGKEFCLLSYNNETKKCELVKLVLK